MGFTVFHLDGLEFRPPQRGDQRRGLAPLSHSLSEMRANVWRLPAGVHGGRHVEHAQEELYVVLEGTLTMMVGEPPERVEAPQGSVVVVGTDTGQQLRNESGADVVVLAVGAPPVQGQAEHLPDPD